MSNASLSLSRFFDDVCYGCEITFVAVRKRVLCGLVVMMMWVD